MATSKIEKVTNNSGSNYCKMPDGTLVQFGSVRVDANVYIKNAYFAIPFIDTNYYVCLQPKESGTDWNTGTKATGYVTIGRYPNTEQNNYDYIAIGRWK